MKQEKEILEIINNWKGETNNPIGYALRNKIYDCFNGVILKVGEELTSIVNAKDIKNDTQKVVAIKSVLAKHNIYIEGKKKSK